MRVGLFGGTFDPVHYGHLLLAETCREQCDLDEITQFLPLTCRRTNRMRWSRQGELAEMIELAVAGNPGILVSRYRLEHGGVSYTVDTLRHFRDETPEAELFFLMVADMFNDLPNWRSAEEVCRLAVPIVAQRAGAIARLRCLRSIATPERISEFLNYQVEMPQIELSSTEIRNRVAEGRSIRYRTPRPVRSTSRPTGSTCPRDCGGRLNARLVAPPPIHRGKAA